MAQDIPQPQQNPEMVAEFDSSSFIPETSLDVQLKADVSELILRTLAESGELEGKTPEEIARLTGQIAAGGAIGALKDIGLLEHKPDEESRAEGTMGVLLGGFMQNGSEVHDEAMTDYQTIVNPNAIIDSKTGAYTLKGLEKRLRDNDTNPPQAVIITDVKNFKSVNDRISHERGDDLIKGVYAVIAKSLRLEKGGDLIARLNGEGGDEFIAVLCDDSAGRDRDPSSYPLAPSELIELAKSRIAKNMQEFMQSEENKDIAPFHVDISIGGVEWKEHTPFRALINEADTEMKKHKKELEARDGKYNRKTRKFVSPPNLAA